MLCLKTRNDKQTAQVLDDCNAAATSKAKLRHLTSNPFFRGHGPAL